MKKKAQAKRKRKLTDVRNSLSARLADYTGLYYPYRLFKIWQGFENPFVCVVKVTTECNLNCSHCPWKKKGLQQMSTEQIKKRIYKGYMLGCDGVILEGGEPTLRNDLSEILDYINSLNLLKVVITNGQNGVKGITADSIWISVEGDEQIHDSIRGKGTYKKIKQTIRDSNKTNINLLMTISKKNRSSVKDLPREFPDQGIMYNFLYPYSNIKEQCLSPGEVHETAQEILSLKRKYSNIIMSDTYLRSAGLYKCCDDWWTYTVDSRGRGSIRCTVEQIEKCHCSECFLSCYGEPYHAVRLSLDSISMLAKGAGLKNFTHIISRVWKKSIKS